jgi:hypothetical protein
MAADLEQLLAPADLIPVGPLVPARRLVQAIQLVPRLKVSPEPTSARRSGSPSPPFRQLRT